MHKLYLTLEDLDSNRHHYVICHHSPLPLTVGGPAYTLEWGRFDCMESKLFRVRVESKYTKNWNPLANEWIYHSHSSHLLLATHSTEHTNVPHRWMIRTPRKIKNKNIPTNQTLPSIPPRSMFICTWIRPKYTILFPFIYKTKVLGCDWVPKIEWIP